MTVRIEQGDIFASTALAVVIPVNCVGTCGKGLALEAARRWPDWAAAYKQESLGGHVEPGGVYAHLVRGPVVVQSRFSPRFFLSFATKDHWRDPSQMEWIEKGLHKLVAFCTGAHGPLSLGGVAVPALGCGHGGLPWDGDDGVRARTERILGAMKGIEFIVYAPRAEARRGR